MAYTNQTRNDYTLADAFHAVGQRLYGPEWSGREIKGERALDPADDLQQRGRLERKAEGISLLLNTKTTERDNSTDRQEIFQLNHDIEGLGQQRSEIWNQIHKLRNVDKSEPEDFACWERFRKAEGTLLQGLGQGHIHVYCPFQLGVPEKLWRELPEDFGYNLLLSIILWPESECASSVGTARIAQSQFEAWLETLIPIVEHDEARLKPEQSAMMWFREEIKGWDGRTTRDQFKEMALHKFPGLSVRGFKRIWDSEATATMKKPGNRKKL